MGKKIPTSVSFNLPDGREVVIETGKLATQADGSVLVRCGKTMIFASVVSKTEVREGQSWFPLSVDYQEKFAAAGRIPGNFFRREARLSDYEIIICRLVDRAIRPLFPEGYMYDTQVIINLLSAELNTPPDAFVALAASAALAVSDIPFDGPISEVRVAKIGNDYMVNPNKDVLENATINLIIAATLDNVVMVEGEAKECAEKEMVEAIKTGHDAIKTQIKAQLDLAQLVGEKATVKREFEPPVEDEDLYNEISGMYKSECLEITSGHLDKKTRKERFKDLEEKVVESITESKGEEYVEENSEIIGRYIKKINKETIRGYMLENDIRIDGRKTTDIRDIWTEIDYLPSTHGSSIFTRGETQALCTVTLGTKLDEKMIDNALEQYFDKFYLHYNFPALSVGEVKPMRGPGRREVGHENLAGRSLKQVLPSDNPYTVRIVSDIMESNGSSSMATVCGGSLALMDSGLPIKAPVSGIAMGMISENGKSMILSDILGDEDALGDMDFKVTGTEKGICACQMDIKIDGLPYEQLEQALEQARQGRLHILDEMSKTISQPREDLKPHAPRIVEMIIEKSFIGAVIGPGGKIIQEIQQETSTIINISEEGDKGIVNISSSDKASIEAAVDRIKKITHVPEVGDVYEAKVVSIQPYGVFVEFYGNSGLLHVSEISYSRIEDVSEVFSEGDMVKVKLVGVDKRSGKFRLSRKVLLPKPTHQKDKNPNVTRES